MKTFLLSLILSFPTFAFGNSIDAIIKKSLVKPSELGIYITSARNPETPVYKLNEGKSLIPASLTKLITAAVALEKMPPGHTFQTELVSAKPPKAKAIEGSLYLVGDGDPGFVSEYMWVLVNHFTRTGIDEIKGDIVVDDYKFDDVRFDPSRDPGSVDRAYDSPIGAMTFNWSAVNVYVRPAEKVGQPVDLFLDPQNDYFRLVNQAKTVSGSKNTIAIKLTPSKTEGTVEDILVTGEFGIANSEKVIFRAIDKPEIWAGYNLKSFLERRGIKVHGKVRRGRGPTSGITLASVESKPLGLHVSDMLKFSNNYVAEILAKNLAADFKKRPASMEDGIQFMRDYLDGIGLKDFRLINPSGLSRKNRFTALHFHELLERMRLQSHLHPEFLAGLPIGGVDGTLKNRLKELAKKGNVRAKTGMLNGVAGLAGYIAQPNDILTFTMIYNGPGEKTVAARELFDAIVLKLAR